MAKSEKIKARFEKTLIFGWNDDIFMCGENDCVQEVFVSISVNAHRAVPQPAALSTYEGIYLF